MQWTDQFPEGIMRLTCDEPPKNKTVSGYATDLANQFMNSGMTEHFGNRRRDDTFAIALVLFIIVCGLCIIS